MLLKICEILLHFPLFVFVPLHSSLFKTFTFFCSPSLSLSLSKLFFLFCRHLTEGGPACSFRCCLPQNLSSPPAGVGSEASPGTKQFCLYTRSILKVALPLFRKDDLYTDLVKCSILTCAIMSSTLSALVKDDFATGSSSVTWSLGQGFTICIQHFCSNYELASFCTSGFSVRQAVFLG